MPKRKIIEQAEKIIYWKRFRKKGLRPELTEASQHNPLQGGMSNYLTLAANGRIFLYSRSTTFIN